MGVTYPDEAVEDFTDHRRNILNVLDRESPLLVSKLRERAGFPAGSKNYHLGKLEEWGLITVVDRVGDDNERKWDLTPAGEQFIADHLHAENMPAWLDDRLGEIEARLDALDERKLDESRFEKLRRRLENEYWQGIIDEIEARV